MGPIKALAKRWAAAKKIQALFRGRRARRVVHNKRIYKSIAKYGGGKKGSLQYMARNAVLRNIRKPRVGARHIYSFRPKTAAARQLAYLFKR